MPTRRGLPRWAGPVAFIGLLAFALLASNQTAPVPQGYGKAILNDTQYEEVFNRMQALSKDRLVAYDAGRPLSTDDLAKLREAGNLVDLMDTYRPLMASYFFLSGKIHHVLGEDEIAEQMFRQCVLGMDRQMADQPQAAPILRATGGEAAYQLSQLLFLRHDYKGALEQAQLAVLATPTDARYHVAVASALNELRRTDEAKGELTKALGFDPKNAQAASLLRLIQHSSQTGG